MMLNIPSWKNIGVINGRRGKMGLGQKVSSVYNMQNFSCCLDIQQDKPSRQLEMWGSTWGENLVGESVPYGVKT